MTREIFGGITAYLYKSGRGSEFRVQDIWLASQAVRNNMKLLIKKEKDFKDIPGLELVVYRQGEIVY